LRRSKIFIVAALWLTLGSAVYGASWDDIGEGVCAALCDSSDWSTDTGVNSGGRRWVSPEEITRHQERLKEWKVYKAKRAARTAAQREFKHDVRVMRKNVRKRWKGRTAAVVTMPAKRPVSAGSGAGVMFGIVASPSAYDISLAGIELARPVSVRPKGEVTHFSLDGLKKFSAIIEYYKDSIDDSKAKSNTPDEELIFLLNEGAAQMSGEASRISVQLPYSADRDEDGLGALKAFKSSWSKIEESRREIRKSEDQRMGWAGEAARVTAAIKKLDARIKKSSGRKKARLTAKRAKKVLRVSVLRDKFEEAEKNERAQTAVISASKKRAKKKYEAFGSILEADDGVSETGGN